MFKLHNMTTKRWIILEPYEIYELPWSPQLINNNSIITTKLSRACTMDIYKQKRKYNANQFKQTQKKHSIWTVKTSLIVWYKK